jgi:hypothetical protein
VKTTTDKMERTFDVGMLWADAGECDAIRREFTAMNMTVNFCRIRREMIMKIRRAEALAAHSSLARTR